MTAFRVLLARIDEPEAGKGGFRAPEGHLIGYPQGLCLLLTREAREKAAESRFQVAGEVMKAALRCFVGNCRREAIEVQGLT